MHLTHPANTLTAEIFIAGDATVLRRRTNNTVITNADELILCGRFGVSGRASDPRIGSDVNTLARQGFAITIKDPIGLYIAGINTTGWLNPSGQQIGNFFRIVRGTAGAGLRAVFEVPANEGFVVGDIRIGARKIEFGGQIAENINVKLTGIACRQGSLLNQAVACVDAGGPSLAPVEEEVHPRAIVTPED